MNRILRQATTPAKPEEGAAQAKTPAKPDPRKSMWAFLNGDIPRD